MKGTLARYRIVICLSILSLLTAGVFFGGWLLQPKPRVDFETYQQIRIGMTLRDVEAIIGAPPGDYGVGKGVLLDFGLDTAPGEIDTRVRKDWLLGDQGISIWLDEMGTVQRMLMPGVHRDYDNTLDWLMVELGIKARKARPVYVLDEIQ
jgi:hypothetical protein